MKANSLVNNKKLILLQDSYPPRFFHFSVRTQKGLADVFFFDGKGWKCGATDENGFGCVMTVSRPYKISCAHVLACFLYAKEQGYREEIFKREK